MDMLQGFALVTKAMVRRDRDIEVAQNKKELEAALILCQNEDDATDGELETEILIKIDGQSVGSLEKPDMEAIVAAGKPALFGKGAETVHDETVRKGLDITADRISLEYMDGKKTKQLTDLADLYEVKGNLSDFFGCAVSCIPYKINVYRPGDFFETHVDTARSADHLGTLVVFFRTEYEGGTLLVWTDDEKKSSPLNGTYEVTYGAFHADACHKIEPVLWGTRITLVCNVLRKGDKDESDDSDDDEDGSLLGDLWPNNAVPIQFNARPDQHQPIPPIAPVSGARKARVDRFLDLLAEQKGRAAFILRHLYSKASLTVECLKGVDRVLVEEMKRRWKRVCVTPMVVTTTDRGRYDEIDVAFIHERLLLDHDASIDDLLGCPPPAKKRKTELLLISAKDSAWLIKHTRGAEYTGNEAAPEEHVYWVTAVVVDFDE